MRNSRSEIAEIKADLEGELRQMAAALAYNPSLSTKIKDTYSEFDERKFCVDSILTHIAGLAKMIKNSAEYKTSISAIKECMSVYNRAKAESDSHHTARAFMKANTQIRTIIFSDLEGEYSAKAEKHFSASDPLPRREQAAVVPQQSRSDPLPKTSGLRSFSVFKSAVPPSPKTEKTLKCSVIAMQIPPNENNLKTLPVKSMRAYVRCGNDLYYVNKARNSIAKLKDINADMLRRFDAAAQPNENAKVLSKTELNAIAGIIGNKGHNYKKPVAEEQRNAGPTKNQ